MVRNSSFICATLPDNEDFWDTDKQLSCGHCGTGMLEVMKNLVNIHTMFPDETMNAWIQWD